MSKKTKHRAAKPRTASASGTSSFKIEDTSKVQFARSKVRNPAYEEIRVALGNMTVGQSLIVPASAEVDQETQMNRLNATFKRTSEFLPKGTALRKRKTADGGIALTLVKAE